ncbi:hypothetical protein Lal_00050240 [Lupinus albus]|uniref:Uncharacterized protein n=1 Tax=Lupinus albus TaxID=3870 RepID=A0A6A4PLL9_LUPAL|nr:hypothetical protein Lalb_Chr12g0198511 [Lupinus albus]KAF1867806.1 hypothetical protein Lal_00050240 [Lupinus albus]
MAEERDSITGSPHSPKNNVRSTLCFSCCFPHNRIRPRLVHSSSLQKPRGLITAFPHLKEKCTNFISRIGRHHRRHSADFHYDPLSYALNFEDNAADDRSVHDLKSFSARLPSSPPSKTSPTANATAEIVARS